MMSEAQINDQLTIYRKEKEREKDKEKEKDQRRKACLVLKYFRLL